MPLREDLLTPIEGEKPAGEDLYYDKVFDQIKEARREEVDDLPTGAWERSAAKKADYRAVIKLGGEALAKRSKDLRIAGWLVDAQVRMEGFSVVAPSINLIREIQENFWDGFFPLIEEGDDREMRVVAVEAAANLIANAARKVAITKSGLTYDDYLESRAVGYEKDAKADARKAARNDAIAHNKLTAEEFDLAFEGSPKSLYLEAEAMLAEALQAMERLDEHGREAYPKFEPNLQKPQQTLEEIHRVVEYLLNERRKTDPDPLPVVEELPVEEGGHETTEADAEAEPGAATAVRRSASAGQLGRIADAYGLVVESAEFIFDKDPKSPVPYLVCAGLRLGEARMQEASPAPGFAVGPSSEVRQSLRTLANKGAWRELLRASLPILAGECARAWLDLHRYVWRAGQETGAPAISEAVVGTVKSLLAVRPELRDWTLEDDTGAANPETQQWLDATVLKG